jgi:microcystin-dependent protein
LYSIARDISFSKLNNQPKNKFNMAQPYVGEIRMFAGNFAPAGWMFCEGQLVPISENETLFNLIGTTYGGDGESTFALPDHRGRLPIHQGTGGGVSVVLAEIGGVESVTLTTNQIPAHNHSFLASNSPADSPSPQNNTIAVSSNTNVFINDTPNVTMKADELSIVGGSQPHSNMQPYLCVSFIISLYGIFPSPT